jgi:hypothetical protein
MKRGTKTGVVLLMALSCTAASFARKDESVDQLKARVSAASEEQRVSLCLEIAERQLDAAVKLYSDEKAEDGAAAVKDVVSYSEQATEAATQTGKKIKHAEIELRKMAHSLRDLKRTIPFEDQPTVQEAADRLEKLRTELLTKMFGTGKKNQ